MKKNINFRFDLFFVIIIALVLKGCYSFTGGSVPEHLKTLYISSVVDNSSFGNPAFKTFLMEQTLNVFQKDNSFNLVNVGGDARLSIVLTSIKETPVSVNPGELETERRVTVNCDVEYYDNKKRKKIFTKSFSTYGVYAISNAFTARDEAVQVALKQIADDILLAVVSGW